MGLSALFHRFRAGFGNEAAGNKSGSEHRELVFEPDDRQRFALIAFPFAVFGDIGGADRLDFGKGVTPKEQYPHHYGHETAGAKIVSKFGHNIKAPNNLIKCGKTACLEHMRGGIFYKMKPSKKVEFIERVSKSILGLDGLQIVVMADKTSGGRENNIDDISFEKIGKRCLKEINGEYIEKKYNLKPGLQFGNKLHEERIKWIKENLNNIQN